MDPCTERIVKLAGLCKALYMITEHVDFSDQLNKERRGCHVLDSIIKSLLWQYKWIIGRSFPAKNAGRI